MPKKSVSDFFSSLRSLNVGTPFIKTRMPVFTDVDITTKFLPPIDFPIAKSIGAGDRAAAN